MKHSDSESVKTSDALIAKADDCLKIAGAQHESANKQHLNADKLHVLARGLKSEAAEIKHKAGVDAGHVQQ